MDDIKLPPLYDLSQWSQDRDKFIAGLEKKGAFIPDDQVTMINIGNGQTGHPQKLWTEATFNDGRMMVIEFYEGLRRQGKLIEVIADA